MSSNVEPRTFGHGTMEGNRDVDACKATLSDAFNCVMENAEAGRGAAPSAELPPELQELIKQAEASGWHRDVAEEAVRQLARNSRDA